MKAQDQGEMIIEGSDYIKAIASKRQHGGVTGEGFDEDEVDGDYMVFLGELGALADVGKGKKVDKGSKRLRDSDEEIRQEWLTMEKALNAADSDEKIWGGDRLIPEKALSAADSDVPGEAGEIGARKGVDADEGEIGSDEEEDDYDPDYMRFYQNLKPRGTAYVLEIARGNDIKIVKYEDEDEFLSSDERKRKVPNPVGRPPRARRSDGLHREMKNLEIGRGQVKRHGNLPQWHSKGERDRKVPNLVGRPPRARRSNDLHREMKNLEIGCGQLQRCGNLPQRHSKGERDKKSERAQIPHHEQIDKDYNMLLRGLKMSERAQILHHEKIDKDYYMFLGDLKMPQRHRKGERDKKSERAQIPHHEQIDKDYSMLVRGLKMLERAQIPHHEKIDQDYYMFLGGLKMPGDSLVYESKDGIQYRYDESAESASDSDSEGSPKPPPSIGRMTPEPSNKRLVPSGKRVPSNKSVEGEFRQGVMDILLKPYSKKEHVDLLKRAKLRKPIVRSHEMRNRSVEFPDERTMGKSFLDHYGDLRKKIRAVQQDDPLKALHLLRGLVFYIEHLCMEDQFKPWNDDSWLEAMNRSTSRNHH